MKHQEQLEKNLVNIKIQPKRSGTKKDDLNKIDIVDQEPDGVDFYK